MVFIFIYKTLKCCNIDRSLYMYLNHEYVWNKCENSTSNITLNHKFWHRKMFMGHLELNIFKKASKHCLYHRVLLYSVLSPKEISSSSSSLLSLLRIMLLDVSVEEIVRYIFEIFEWHKSNFFPHQWSCLRHPSFLKWTNKSQGIN